MPALGLFGSLDRERASVKSVFADRGNGCGDEECTMAALAVERICADLGQGGGKRDAFKIVPVAECVVIDLDDALTQDQSLDGPVAIICILHGMYDGFVALNAVDGQGLLSFIAIQMCPAVLSQEVGHAVLVGVEGAGRSVPYHVVGVAVPVSSPALGSLGKRYVYVVGRECILTDRYDGGGQIDVTVVAVIERACTDAFQTLGKGDVAELGAFIECIIANDLKRRGKVDGFEVVAVIECICRDLDHALGQGDLGQIAVASEYVGDDGLVAVHAGDDDLLCLAVVVAHVSVAAVGENVGDTVFVCVNVLVIPDDRCRTPVFMPARGLGCAGDRDGTVSKGVLADGGNGVGNDQILDRSAFKRALADLLKGCGQGQLL